MQKVDSGSTNRDGRRKWLAWMGLLLVFPLWKMRALSGKKAVKDCAPPGKKETMKLLSQDGQLVEVDVSRIKILEQKVSDNELRNWINKP